MAKYLFPATAVAMVAAVVAEMLAGHHATSSLGYVGFLGSSLVILSLAIAIRAATSAPWREKAEPRGDDEEQQQRNYRLVALLLGMTAAVILTIEMFGYLLVMFTYLVVVGRLLYRGSWRVTLATSFGMILLVHMMFVGQLQLDLPAGTMWRNFPTHWLG